MEEDGTEIEDTDYLLSLPDNTCLILLQKGKAKFEKRVNTNLSFVPPRLNISKRKNV